MNKLRKSKKGSGIMDLVFTFIFIIVITITSVIAGFIMIKFNEAWNASDAVPDLSKEASTQYETRFTGIIDGAIIFYYMILFILTIVTSFYLDSSPLFFIVFIIVAAISYAIFIPFSLFFDQLALTQLGLYYNTMVMTKFFIENIAIFLSIHIMAIGGSLYFKSRF